MDISALKALGLTNREIEVYLKLLEKGEAPAGALAKETSVSRTHVYEALQSLIDRGIVSSVTRDFRKHYKAAEPEKLLKFVRETEDKIHQLLPQLKILQKPPEKAPKIEVYEGKEGIKTIFFDTLNMKKKELLAINVSEHTKEILGPFAKQYFKQKTRKRIKSRVIFSKKFEFLDPTAEKRFMLKKDISPAMTVIYDDKVVVILWLEKPIGIMIESKEAAKEYCNYFEILWQQATQE